MKNKNLFYYIIFPILIIGALWSCERSTPEVKSINSLGKFPYNSNIDELSVVEIDGCEYIVCNAFGNKDIAITHKGNCKYCTVPNNNNPE